MKTGARIIKSGNQFNHLFREVSGKTVIRKRFAQLSDTVQLMQEVIATTLKDTEGLAKLLKRDSQKASCKAIWDFCFNHLQYQKDQTGKEQVRSPARSWRDRVSGVDCDCLTVFIGSLLSNLQIPFSIRLTRYHASDFEHVYPVAHTNEGTIILDCVVHQFNYEVPFTQKKDIKMELQYLNGFEDDEFSEFGQEDAYPEFSELPFSEDDLEGLDGKAERKAKTRKGLHVINRLNPATALLRAGVLASLKLNLMNVAGKLRYAYWSDEKAKQNNVDLSKLSHLKTIYAKIEKVFYGAGGKPENLKEAILKGRGNRDKKVALSGLGWFNEPVTDMDDLKTILGNQVFYDELFEVQREAAINGLGEPVTASAAIAASSGIIATIAGLLKKLGSIFRKGTPQDSEELISDNAAGEEDKKRLFSISNIAKRLTSSDQNLPIKLSAEEESVVDTELTDQTSARAMDTKSGTTPDEGGGVMQWIKDHPLLTAGIAATVIAGTVWIVKSRNSSKVKSKKELNGMDGLDGFKKKKQTKKSSKSTTKRKPMSKSTKGRMRIQKVELL